MKVLKKKAIAILIMSLIILLSLVLTEKASAGEAAIILLILLAIFTTIDFTMEAKFLKDKQSRYASIVVGLIAIATIGIWGTISVPGTLVSRAKNAGQNNAPITIMTDETYELGLSYFEKSNYEEAIQTLKEVADSSASYVEAQKLLAEATDQYRVELIGTANTYVEKDDFKLAIDILNAGLLVIPKDAELLQTIEDYSLEYTNSVRSAAIADAEVYAAKQDYANVMTAILDARNEIGSDAELDALLKKYTVEYKEFALAKADIIFNSEGYEAAIKFLQEVQKFIVLDDELSNAMDEYKSYKPVAISDLDIWRTDPIYGSCGPSYDSITDNYGNTYSPYFDKGGSNIYRIDKQYSTLSGIFCVKENDNSSNDECRLYIWKITNGQRSSLLYDTVLTGGKTPVEFSIDISGLDFIEICVWEGYGLDGIAFAANLFLAK